MNITKTVIIGLITAMLVSLAPIAGATVTTTNPTTRLIPDTGLEQAIRKQLKKPTGALTASDLARLTKLDASGMRVRSLNGLGGAVNLTELELFNNQVSDLSPISGLRKLTKLFVESNQLKSVCPIVGNFTTLTEFDAANNQITEVGCLSKLKSLTDLRLSKNAISDISTLVNIPADYVELTDNLIEDVAVIANWPNLAQLYLANNPFNNSIDPLLLSLRAEGATVDLENAYDIQVFLNSSVTPARIPFRVAPLLRNGTTLVEFRPIFEKLGYAIRFDSVTKTITGTKPGLSLNLRLGNNNATVNGTARTLNVAPQAIGGSTMVPLRFIAEASGKEVSWNAFTRSILISTLDEQIIDTIDKSLYYFNSLNAPGTISLYSRDYPDYALLEDVVTEGYAELHTAYQSHTAVISGPWKFISRTASQVVVEYEIVTFLNSRDTTKGFSTETNQVKQTFKKNAGGLWQIVAEE